MIDKYYEQDQCVNVEKSRSFYVPFDVNQTYNEDYKKSKRYFSLNGKWRIKGYSNFESATDFLNDSFDNVITVPSCVQYYGYDYFQYTNYHYPFPYNPPFVPKNNPCFHFGKIINIAHNDFKKYLIFEGVDSAFYLYVNKKFVGYSYISHRISEFDVTDFIVDGENFIDVLVLKWNLGSYLEDQDKFRFTGIFRDVYILFRDKKHIKDYRVDTDYKGHLTFTNKSDVDISISIQNLNAVVKANTTSEFDVDNVKAWSAEEPNLYLLKLLCGDEIIYEQIGFRTSEVKDGKYLLNGKPIKFYGINRHDFHPKKGMAVSDADILNDLLLMKSLNINAIRTSHYPSSPYFYQMCNKLGFYVMSESDVETHGTILEFFDGMKYFEGLNKGAFEPLFKTSMKLRQICNVEEHKNFACVVMFSLGNESGWGENIVESLDLLHELDNRPIHYEGLFSYQNVYGKDDIYYAAKVDIVSQMYSSIDKIKEDSVLDTKEHRPFLLCEYAHAMGNGPGGLDEYWDLFENNECMMGAFMWEWCDHGIEYHGRKGLYGGDFNEPYHDSNFCLDGIVTADRVFKAGTYVLKHAYQPAYITKQNNTIYIKNRLCFINLNATVEVIDGDKISCFDINLKPQEIYAFEISSNEVSIVLKNKGHEIAYQSFSELSISYNNTDQNNLVKIEENNESISVLTETLSWNISKFNGEITCKNGLIYSIAPYFYRANIDNDRLVKKEWDSIHLSDSKVKVKSFIVLEKSVELFCEYSFADNQPSFVYKLVLRFYNNSIEFDIDYTINPLNDISYFPRVGLVASIDRSLNNIHYKGLGPYMTYSDLYRFGKNGEYYDMVDNQYFHFPKPQENGFHYRPSYFEVHNFNKSITVRGAESVACLPYCPDTIAKTMHDFDLKHDNFNYLYFDFFQSGLGTNACGPIPDKASCIPLCGKRKILLMVEEYAKD